SGERRAARPRTKLQPQRIEFMTQKVINILGHENVLAGPKQLHHPIFTEIARIIMVRKHGAHQEMRSEYRENPRVITFDTAPATPRRRQASRKIVPWPPSLCPPSRSSAS